MARVLFLTSRLPWPPREGHQLRSCNLLRAVAAAHDVQLLSLRRPEDAAAIGTPCPLPLSGVHTVPLPMPGNPRDALGVARRAIAGRQPLLVARYLPPELEQAFRARVARAELVHFDMLPLTGLARLVPASVPVVLNAHNVESELLRRQARVAGPLWKRLLMRHQLPLLARFEAEACARADRVLACSAPDATRLRELAPAARVDIVPNGVDLGTFDGPDAAA